MQAASDITVAAYRETGSADRARHEAGDISQIMAAAMAKRGGTPEFTLVLLGEASAYPHGSQSRRKSARRKSCRWIAAAATRAISPTSRARW
jgi:Xaa-Pro aminopeptidase